MSVKHEVIYGGLGDGKSTYALSIINPKDTFKLGNMTKWREFLVLRWGAIRKHEEENIRVDLLQFRRITVKSVIDHIAFCTQPTLLIDEWRLLHSKLYSGQANVSRKKQIT